MQKNGKSLYSQYSLGIEFFILISIKFCKIVKVKTSYMNALSSFYAKSSFYTIRCRQLFEIYWLLIFERCKLSYIAFFLIFNNNISTGKVLFTTVCSAFVISFNFVFFVGFSYEDTDCCGYHTNATRHTCSLGWIDLFSCEFEAKRKSDKARSSSASFIMNP